MFGPETTEDGTVLTGDLGTISDDYIMEDHDSGYGTSESDGSDE